MNTNSMAQTTIKIVGVDTVPEHDPYHRGQGVSTSTVLKIDPRDMTVWVNQDMDQGATPMDEWHGRVLTFDLGTAEEYADYSSRTPDGEALENYLNSETAQRLLETICDEYDIYFDGNNMIGRHTEETHAAVDALLAGIAALPHTEYYLWQTDDWFPRSDSGITAGTTDEEIAELADQYGDGSEYEGGIVILDEDVATYLRQIRDEMVDDIEEEEDGDE